MYKFISRDELIFDGAKHVLVKNPKECKDFSHLVGHTVEINGAKAKVLGVECLVHAPPWRKGGIIGLRYQPLKPQ